MPVQQQPDSLGGLGDDQLGTIAVALAISELRWTPDVAPAVMDRISRDALAYPEHFDRRQAPSPARRSAPASGRSVGRTLSRVVVLAIIIVLVAALVMVAATANAAYHLGGDPPAYESALPTVTEAP